MSRRVGLLIGAGLFVTAALLAWHLFGPRSLTVASGVHPEELVYVRASDDVINAGVMFTPPKAVAKPIAVIWIHGYGVNFYSPTYVMIGRELAERGYLTISVNHRRHDLRTVAGYRFGRRIRGGAYWGLLSETRRDLDAWIDFAEQMGFRKVILVGHSAGWAVVRGYQAESQDERVAGVVLASGGVIADLSPPDPKMLAEAKRLVEAGRGEEIVKDPNRSSSVVSAATFLDFANTPAQLEDFFGLKTKDPVLREFSVPFSPSLELAKGTSARKNI